MKIATRDIFNNWDYWIKEKMIMQDDPYIEIDSEKYELYGLKRRDKLISYLDGDSVKEKPSAEIKYIYIDR